MNIADADTTLYLRRKHTSPPDILLLRVSNNKDRYYHYDHRPHQQQKRQPPHMIGLHVNDLDIHDTSSSTFSWQRHSDKITQIAPAPDIAYRNTYLEEAKREKSDRNNRHRSSSQKHYSHQYRTIYDYIREFIRETEQQRNLKQNNLSFCGKRPQNEDSTFRRVLGEKRPSARICLSRSSSTTTQTQSSFINNDLKSPQSFVNYINYSRVHRSTTPNQSYERQLSSALSFKTSNQ